MDQSPADNNLLNALNLVPNEKPITEATSEPTPSTENQAVEGERKVQGLVMCDVVPPALNRTVCVYQSLLLLYNG